MIRFHRQLDLRGPLVSCNGALVKDAETGEVLRERLLLAPLAAAIVAEGDRRGITQNYYHTDGGLYVREKTGWTDLYQSRTGSDVTIQPDLESFRGESALKIIWIDAPDRVERMREEMAAAYGNQLYITTTDAEYLEFMALGVSKAAGAAAIAERLNIASSEVIAFGDGNNDVPLLEWAGLGVAMSHARPSAQAAADRIAPPGNPETDFARAVEMLLREI
jgi:hydroxymethylpyrimidine pyrophosphatase-like HAD family hydrolase